MSLSASTIGIMKATAPVVAVHGVNITTRMYDIMFTRYPEVRNVFNQTHIKKKDSHGIALQPHALANAVQAYAENADNLGALNETVANMIHKHVSFDIKPEHYPIVGECLLEAMKDVLGDAATDQVLDGWKDGYQFLADLLIAEETKLKNENAKREGGWEGYKSLLVVDKVKESENITSFIMEDQSGQPATNFTPGQYLSLCIPKGELEGFDYDVVRNYSVSSKPGDKFYRMSVKREGLASNYLHDDVKVGAHLKIGFPCGTFVLKGDHEKPIVLIAGGVGMTPIISMLEYIVNSGFKSKVYFLLSVRSDNDHPMKTRIDQLGDSNSNLSSHVFYTRVMGEKNVKNTEVHSGRITKEILSQILPSPLGDNDYYFCGPPSFLGHIKTTLEDFKVPKDKINFEYFGPLQ